MPFPSFILSWRKRRAASPPPRAVFGVFSRLAVLRHGATGVCEKTKNTPPDNNTGWSFSFERTKSGAGSQILLLSRMAKAQVK